MAPDATLLWAEILSPGRTKSGEEFQYREVKMDFQIWRGGRCLIYDPLLLSYHRTKREREQIGLLEKHSYIGSLWLVAPDLEWLDIAQLNKGLQQSESIRGGATFFKSGLASVRWLATDMVRLRQEMDRVWAKLSKGIVQHHSLDL
jgi:urease accessory protein